MVAFAAPAALSQPAAPAERALPYTRDGLLSVCPSVPSGTAAHAEGPACSRQLTRAPRTARVSALERRHIWHAAARPQQRGAGRRTAGGGWRVALRSDGPAYCQPRQRRRQRRQRQQRQQPRASARLRCPSVHAARSDGAAARVPPCLSAARMPTALFAGWLAGAAAQRRSPLADWLASAHLRLALGPCGPALVNAAGFTLLPARLGAAR
jgi:hypothetical protein